MSEMTTRRLALQAERHARQQTLDSEREKLLMLAAELHVQADHEEAEARNPDAASDR